jgi:hypothetical protein
MLSIRAVAGAMRQVLTTVADEAAVATGCVRRVRQFSGSSLLLTLTVGWLAKPQASLVDLTQVAARHGVTVTPQGLDQRFTPALAATIRAVLDAAVQAVIADDTATLPLLERFTGGVWVLDSSTITLPDELADDYPGCGGGADQGQAGLKLHVALNLSSGALHGPDLTASRSSDRASALQHEVLSPDSLRLHDRQYVVLPVLRQIAAAGGYWLSRYHTGSALSDPDGTVWTDRAHRLATAAQETAIVDLTVALGRRERLPARLVAVRLSQEHADRQRAAVKRRARRNGYTASAAALALAGWLLVITNVPAERLSGLEVLVLLRARWQIERLFRRWKSIGGLAQWRTSDRERIHCEVLAKLLGCVIEHWIIVVSSWDVPEYSLDRASAAVRAGSVILASVITSPRGLIRELTRLTAIIRATCRITTRGKHPSYAQLLRDPSRLVLN